MEVRNLKDVAAFVGEAGNPENVKGVSQVILHLPELRATKASVLSTRRAWKVHLPTIPVHLSPGS